MPLSKIQSIFLASYQEYCSTYSPSPAQNRTAHAIMNCKSGYFGFNISTCHNCGASDYHHNSCRNRHCPECQAMNKEFWIDARKSEVIDAPYFHVVFTLPAELRPLVYANQRLLYSLLHKCSSETLLQLCADKKYLGAVPGIIQVLHSWTQELLFHPHIHCILSGAGLSETRQLVKRSDDFLIPVRVLGSLFRGKFLDALRKLYETGKLVFSASALKLRNIYEWNSFIDSLYQKQWTPYIKETFNGFGNAIDYLGRYTHKIAISNSRIISVADKAVTFLARDRHTGKNLPVTITQVEFIRRFLMHTLPAGFQKIRYYGFLNNRSKKVNLKLIFRLQGKQQFHSLYQDMNMEDLLLNLWNINIRVCKICGCESMRHAGRTFYQLN